MSVTSKPAAGRPAATLDTEHPWPGLLPFSVEDQEFFRGREEETVELFRQVMRERLTVLFGRSGLGKTSLLRAGLFPRLQEENLLPVYLRLEYSAESDLRGQVLAAIKTHATASGFEFPEARDSETLWEYFHRRGSEFWTPRNRPAIPVLVLDQFEEVFTLGRSYPAATEAIVTELADLAEGRPPAEVKSRLGESPEEARLFSFDRHPYKILLSLREDFLAELERLRQGTFGGAAESERRRWRGILDSRFRLTAMDGENALVVVSLGDLVEEEVALQIVRFVAAPKDDDAEAPLRQLEVAPALLSVVCRSLNERRLKRGASRISSDDVEGSRDQILIKFYDDSVRDLGRPMREFIEERLLTTSGYRNRVALEDAEEVKGVSRSGLDRLVDRRLLAIEEQNKVKWIELTHDLLTPAIAESRDTRRRQSAKRRRLLISSAAILAGVLVAAVLLWMNDRAMRRAEEAQARAYTFAASAEEDPKRSLYLARAAAEATFPTRGEALPEVEGPLHRGLEESRRKLLWVSPALQDEYEVDWERTVLALSASGRHLAASKNGAVTVWDCDTQKVRILPDAGKNISDLALSPDGQHLAIVARDGSARFWALGSQPPSPSGALADPEGDGVRRVHFSPAGDGVAIVDEGSIRVLRWPSLVSVFEVPLAPDGQGWVFYSLDGRYIATDDGSGSVLIREAKTGEQTWRLGGAGTQALGPVSFSHDGLRIATGSDQQQVRLWELGADSEGDDPAAAAGETLDVSAVQVAFSPSGRSLATIDWDTTLRIWDLPRMNNPFELAEGLGPPLLSLDGRRLVTRAKDGLSLWELVYEPMPTLHHPARVQTAQFDRHGERLATLDRDGSVRLWNMATRQPEGEPPDVTGRALSLHPDDRRAVIADESGAVALWNLETGRKIGLDRVGDKVRTVSFDRSGDRLATGSDDGWIGLFETGSGKLLWKRKGHQARVRALAFDAGGRLASADSRGAVQLWDSAAGSPLESDCGHADEAAVYALAFDPQGSRLASAGMSDVIRICAPGSAEKTFALDRGEHGDSSPIRAVAFSIDGERLASGGRDPSVVVWIVKDRRRHFALSGAVDPVTSLDYSPDGRILAIASWNNSVRLEFVDIEELLRRANERGGTLDGR